MVDALHHVAIAQQDGEEAAEGCEQRHGLFKVLGIWIDDFQVAVAVVVEAQPRKDELPDVRQAGCIIRIVPAELLEIIDDEYGFLDETLIERADFGARERLEMLRERRGCAAFPDIGLSLIHI